MVARCFRTLINRRPKLHRAVQAWLAAEDLDQQRQIFYDEVAPRLFGRTVRWLLGRQMTMNMLVFLVNKALKFRQVIIVASRALLNHASKRCAASYHSMKIISGEFILLANTAQIAVRATSHQKVFQILRSGAVDWHYNAYHHHHRPPTTTGISEF